MYIETTKFQVVRKRYLHSEQLRENGLIDVVSVGQYATFEEARQAAKNFGGGMEGAVETEYQVMYPTA